MLNTCCYIYLRDEKIHVISVAHFESLEYETLYKIHGASDASVDVAILGNEVRTALASYRIVPASQGPPVPSVLETLAGEKRRIKQFLANCGSVIINHDVSEHEYTLDAERFRGLSGQFIEKASTTLRDRCSDKDLGATVIKLLRLSLEANTDSSRANAVRPTASIKSSGDRDGRSTQKGAPLKLVGSNSLAHKLDGLGFFDCADNPRNAYKRVERLGWKSLLSSGSGRCFHADAEELAEGGVAEFVSTIEPFFSAMQVDLPEIESEIDEDRYSVRLGRKSFSILLPSDFKREVREPGILWGAAAFRTSEMLNSLLKRAKLKEKTFATGSGNDLHLLFITPEMYRVIGQAPSYNPQQGFYVLTDLYPSFGAPTES